MSYTANPNRYNDTMRYRKAGNSGILLPEISLGLWHNFGHTDSYQTGLEMVKIAFDNGITHFDLANNYGVPAGSAEENFGRMLTKELAPYRDELFISSKAGHLMWDGLYGDGGSRKYLMASIDQTLKRLNTDYVDVFYSHRYDPNTPLDETLQALVDIVKQGKALYVGLSKYPIEKLIYALDFLKRAGTPCLLYQDKYNLLVRNVEQIHLDTIEQAGTGFVAFSPLAQGLLTDKYLNGIPQGSRAARPEGFLHENQVTTEVIEKVAQLQPIAQERGETIAELALAWLLNNPRTTSVIIGARTPQQLRENIAALKSQPFTPEQLTKIEQLF